MLSALLWKCMLQRRLKKRNIKKKTGGPFRALNLRVKLVPYFGALTLRADLVHQMVPPNALLHLCCYWTVFRNISFNSIPGSFIAMFKYRLELRLWNSASFSSSSNREKPTATCVHDTTAKTRRWSAPRALKNCCSINSNNNPTYNKQQQYSRSIGVDNCQR